MHNIAHLLWSLLSFYAMHVAYIILMPCCIIFFPFNPCVCHLAYYSFLLGILSYLHCNRILTLKISTKLLAIYIHTLCLYIFIFIFMQCCIIFFLRCSVYVIWHIMVFFLVYYHTILCNRILTLKIAMRFVATEKGRWLQCDQYQWLLV